MPSSNLPSQPTSFIGREKELTDIAALFADPNCRLLTLVGAGGIGKTRLALQAGVYQQPHFADGLLPAEPGLCRPDVAELGYHHHLDAIAGKHWYHDRQDHAYPGRDPLL